MSGQYRLEKITQARKKKGWTYAELGRRANVAQSTVKRTEEGITTSPPMVKRLADTLGLDMDELVVK